MATHPGDDVIDLSYKMFYVDKFFVVNRSIHPTQGTAEPKLRIKAPVVCPADILALQ